MRLRDPEELSKQARYAAEAIAGPLERRLREFDGPNWLAAVNARRQEENKRRRRDNQLIDVRRLDDPRSCLAVFAYDESTEGWAPGTLRIKARRLHRLADDAAHNNRGLTIEDLREAESISQELQECYSGITSSPGRAQDRKTWESCQAAGDSSQRGRFGGRTDRSRSGGYTDRRPSKGEDVRVSVHISAQEARDGVIKPVRIHPLIATSRVVRVQIPPQEVERRSLLIPGHGWPGTNGGSPGDLYVTVFIDKGDGDRRHGFTSRNMREEAVYVARAAVLTGQGSTFLALLRDFTDVLKSNGMRKPGPMVRFLQEGVVPLDVAKVVPPSRIEEFLGHANVGELSRAIQELETHLRVPPPWAQPGNINSSGRGSNFLQPSGGGLDRWPTWLVVAVALLILMLLIAM